MGVQKTPFREYPKQQLAFDAVDSPPASETDGLSSSSASSNTLRVFSRELSSTGKRVFCGVDLREFWDYYAALRRWNRHHYEIIRENHPCRLYLDVEFYREFNAKLEGKEESLMELLFQQIADAVQTELGILIGRDAFLDLDSSTPKKFSRHVIVHMPGDQLFRSNLDVGRLVRLVIERSPRDLWVEAGGVGGKQRAHIVDDAVYTKNRAMRLYLSSKVGKAAVLLPAESNRFPCELMSAEGEFCFFLASLASGGQNVDRSLGMKRDLICVWPASVRGDTVINKLNVRRSTPSAEPTVCSLAEVEGLEDLVKFLESRASRGGSRGFVRKIEKQGEHHLRFHIGNNRFCERVSRQHKSNHVFYVVDSERRTYTQGCMDRECRGYWAPDRPIPECCIFNIRDKQNVHLSGIGSAVSPKGTQTNPGLG